MINKRWYRWIRCVFGARSFTKTYPDGGKGYVLVSTDKPGFAINIINAQGFIEEWPKGF